MIATRAYSDPEATDMKNTVYRATISEFGRVFTASANTAKEAATLAWRDSMRATNTIDADTIDADVLWFAPADRGLIEPYPMDDHIKESVLIVYGGDWFMGL
jgi:hypothetical protein